VGAKLSNPTTVLGHEQLDSSLRYQQKASKNINLRMKKHAMCGKCYFLLRPFNLCKKAGQKSGKKKKAQFCLVLPSGMGRRIILYLIFNG
jgi:hypothetical protein